MSNSTPQALDRCADALFALAKAKKANNVIAKAAVDVQKQMLEAQEASMAVTKQLEALLKGRLGQ